MRPYQLILLIPLLSLALASCTGPITATVPPAIVEPIDASAIVEGFYAAYNSGDVDATMAFVDENIQCRGHCYIDGIEGFRNFIAPGIEAGDQITISDLRVDGDTVTFNYEIVSGGIVTARGVDAVMKIEDGKIVYFEIT